MNFKVIIFVLSCIFGLSAQAEIKETVTLVNGEVFHFEMTSKNVDCNGTGFVGADLELLTHDKANKIKVYSVRPDWGPITLIGCDVVHKSLTEKTKSYRSKVDETVVFILNDRIKLVVE